MSAFKDIAITVGIFLAVVAVLGFMAIAWLVGGTLLVLAGVYFLVKDYREEQETKRD